MFRPGRRPHPVVPELRALIPHASRPEVEALARVSTEVALPDGQLLMEEGQWGREAYLLLEGAVEVSVCGSVIASVGAGEVVGELGVLEPRRPRMATIRAVGPVRALVLDMRSFRSVYDLPGLATTMTPTERYAAA